MKQEITEPTQQLVRVIKDGLTADVLECTLKGWLDTGWKKVDEKPAAERSADKAGA